MTSHTDPLERTETFTYDTRGNLLRKQDLLGIETLYEYGAFFGFDKLSGYAYDVEANLESITDPTGRVVSYTYDLRNRVTQMAPSGNGPSVGVTYNGFGDRESLAYSNGISSTSSFDGRGDPTRIDYGTTVGAIDYVRDAVGNPNSITDSIGSNEILSIAYDPQNRPTSVLSTNDPALNETFTYDPNGNLKDPGVVRNLNFDLADQVLGNSNSYFLHDARGNRVETIENGKQTKFQFDPSDRLVRLEERVGGSLTRQVDNIYDGLDRLVSTDYGNGPVLRDYAEDNPLADFNTDGTLRTLYLTGPGLDDVHATVQNGNTSFLHRDEIGSVRAFSDIEGNLTATRNYGLFGRLLKQSGSTNVPLGFTGRPSDGVSGLVDMRARWIDPSMGRFLSCDPIPIELQLILPNPYVYAANRPLRFDDPLGLSPVDPNEILLDLLQILLGLVGLIPGLGEIADALDLAISSIRGDALGATLAGASLLPAGGQIPGLANLARKLGRLLDKFGGLLKFLGKGDVLKDAKKGLEGLENLPKCKGGSCGLGGACFAAGTAISTENGRIPIEKITAGTRVWAQDLDQGENELHDVVRTFERKVNKLIIVGVGEELIQASVDHPFYVATKGWVRAEKLQIGDQVLTSTKQRVAVRSLARIGGDFTVYNFEVDTLHNYYVSGSEVLVHNSQNCFGSLTGSTKGLTQAEKGFVDELLT